MEEQPTLEQPAHWCWVAVLGGTGALGVRACLGYFSLGLLRRGAREHTRRVT